MPDFLSAHCTTLPLTQSGHSTTTSIHSSSCFDAPSSLQPADRATTSYTAPEYKAKDYVASEYKAKEYLANEYKAKEYMAPEYKAKVYVAVGYGAADADAVEPSKER